MMSLHLHVALRSALKSPAITALALLSVAAGVAFQVPNTANLRGYTEELTRLGLGPHAGHVRVTPPEGELFTGATAARAKVEALPHVRGAVARLHYAVLTLRGDRPPQPMHLVGVEPDIESRVTGLCGEVAVGQCLAPHAAAAEIVLGAALARALRANVGEVLRLTFAIRELGDIETTPRNFRVVGIMRGMGGFPADEDAYVERAELAQLLGGDDPASELTVVVDDRRRAAEYSGAIAAALPGSHAIPWTDPSSFVARAVRASEVLLKISSGMVVIAVAIPILALFAISVLRERRQIGVLAAVGLSPRAIFGIYVLRAAVVGLIGAALGALGAFALLSYFRRHPIFDYAGFTIRPVVDLRSVLDPIIVVLAATLVASLGPAFVAARTDPATTLRED